jgi:hypothetical protein
MFLEQEGARRERERERERKGGFEPERRKEGSCPQVPGLWRMKEKLEDVHICAEERRFRLA